MIKPVNWNEQTSEFASMFWDQNTKQFWLDTEIAISKDKKVWESLSETQRDTYMKVLVGLTLLDTEQGGVGMPRVSEWTEDLQDKAVLIFMSAMEQIHAKSYSTIFTTLSTKNKIDEAFYWGENNNWLQKKAKLIDENYVNIVDSMTFCKALIASVYLESFLFYSGFYYPLLLSGQGLMKNAGEIISLIIRDESIHGVFIGLLYQQKYNELSDTQKQELDEYAINFLLELYENECKYSEEIYDSLNLTPDVKKFIRYNANKALNNLGYDQYFKTEDVNPVVLNGLTVGGTMDFFSQKGSDYIKAKVEPLKNSDFEVLKSMIKN